MADKKQELTQLSVTDDGKHLTLEGRVLDPQPQLLTLRPSSFLSYGEDRDVPLAEQILLRGLSKFAPLEARYFTAGQPTIVQADSRIYPLNFYKEGSGSKETQAP